MRGVLPCLQLRRLFTVLAAILGVTGFAERAEAAHSPPNIVVIQADDQALSQLSPRFMPHTFQHLARPGTELSNYIVTTPQCCPSRASLFTGRYAHNNGVFSNSPGYPNLTKRHQVLPVWLQDAGYETAHVGKFMNGYTDLKPAPGWDHWFTKLGHESASSHYYDYSVSDDGTRVHFGDKPHDYVTRVLTQEGVNLLRQRLPKTRSFYLQVDETAPHTHRSPQTKYCDGAAVPDPRDVDAFSDTPLPRPPSFNEHQFDDKPSFIQRLPLLDKATKVDLTRKYQCALAALRGVDRSVAHIWHAVKGSGELHNTVFAFVSDNGYFYGEHRVVSGKVLPYEEAIRQPFILRVPSALLGGAKSPSSSAAPVASIDIAPTLVDLAGACHPSETCATMDGRSLVPLLEGDDAAFQDRDLLIEWDAAAGSPHGVCGYESVRSPDQILVDYTEVVKPQTGVCEPTQEGEHYDLAADRFELENLYPAQPGSPAYADEQSLLNRLAQLEDCSGIAGRDPAPASGHYCD